MKDDNFLRFKITDRTPTFYFKLTILLHDCRQYIQLSSNHCHLSSVFYPLSSVHYQLNLNHVIATGTT